MSFDLAVLSTQRPLNADEAFAVYLALCESRTNEALASLMPSTRMTEFGRELLARYPDLDALPEDEVDGSPWTVSPELSDSHAVLCFVWSRAEEAATFVQRLAAAHGLVVYDPQANAVFEAAGRRSPRPRWKFWER